MNRRLSRLIALLSITFMIVSMAFVMPASAAHTWNEEIIDHAEAVGFASSIGIDNTNNPVIAYGSIFGMNYTHMYGGTWINEQASTDSVQAIDMRMDSSGNPHAAYVFGSYYSTGIKYASKSGGTWTDTAILDNTRMLGFVSMDIDAANNPYILCAETDAGLYTRTLTLFHQSGGLWLRENISAYAGFGGFDMAIGGGSIHVVYENSSAGAIMHGVRPVNGGPWQFDKIVDGGISDMAVSIDLDSSGSPHILLGEMYYTRTDGIWQSVDILATQYGGPLDRVDLYIDSSNRVYSALFISYKLVFAQNTGSGWEGELVRDQNQGWGCSVTADNSGAPHIACHDANRDSLTYLAGTPAGANPDSDSDGLPDSWENSNFGNLNQGPTDDPDGDGHDNLNEYTAGTDPNDSLDPGTGSSTDSDSDGLPDSWENSNFGNLAQGPADDPDNDLYDNLAEYNAGTDPNDPNSTPLDLGGLDILGSLLFWIVAAVVITIIVIVLIVAVIAKGASEILDEPEPPLPPPPVYAYAPPPPQAQINPKYCPTCGRQSRFIPPNGNWCDNCGKYV